MAAVTVYITPSELEKLYKDLPAIVSSEPNYADYRTILVSEKYLTETVNSNALSLNPGGAVIEYSLPLIHLYTSEVEFSARQELGDDMYVRKTPSSSDNLSVLVDPKDLYDDNGNTAVRLSAEIQVYR